MTLRGVTQLKNWQELLKSFKEILAKRLWGLPSVTEAEKEVVFREYLVDLDKLETELDTMEQTMVSERKSASEENDLLRSLLGIPGDELKSRVLILGEELNDMKERLSRREEEATETQKKMVEKEEENNSLRIQLQKYEKNAANYWLQHAKTREDDIRFFSETNEHLRNQLKDLESRLHNLRSLYSDTSQKITTEKQQEIALLQKKLLDEMETTLRRKQEVQWKEEEMFAVGVAQKIRSTLISARGQLMLSLERVGLLNPDTQKPTVWRARIRMLMEGAGELAANFMSTVALLEDVTGTLDEYLHLTNRRSIIREPVSMKSLVQNELAEIYTDRRPTLSVEFLADEFLPEVEGDKSLLKFVVRELIRNAMESLEYETGKVIISLHFDKQERKIRLLVRDTGKGIPMLLQDKLFRPFFTTKPHRHGLSLSRAKRYVEFMNGTLDMIKTGDQGTTFQVLLPLPAIDNESAAPSEAA